MAYSRRLPELAAQLNVLFPDINHPAHRALANCIVLYTPMRETALNDLVELLDDWEPRDRGLADRWKARVDRVRSELDRHFGDSVKDVLLEDPVRVFWANTVEAERAFFATLRDEVTPQRVEDIGAYQVTLRQMTGDLQTNWNDLLGADGSLESDQVRLVRQVAEVIQQLIDEVERQNRARFAELVTTLQGKLRQSVERVAAKVRETVGDKVADALAAALELAKSYVKDELGVPSEVEPDLDRTASETQVYLDKVTYIAKVYRENAAAYRSLMSIERGGVLTMFMKTREQVHAYEESNNLEVANRMRDEAIRALQDWTGGITGDAQDDAEEFVDRVTDVLERDWDACEDARDEFEDRFAGIFTAQLTSDTIETLVEKAMFNREVEIILGLNAADLLGQAQGGLPAAADDAVALATQPLADAGPSFPEELIDLTRQQTESFRAYLRTQLRAQVDRAMTTLGETRTLLDPSRIRQDFSREELEAMLH